MRRAGGTVSWLIIMIMILLSANSFLKSGGDSINAWALLLLIPLPLSFIISEYSKKDPYGNRELEKWDDGDDDVSSPEKQADDPLEAGFDIPIL
jgi:hypothetical protein